MPDLVTTLVGLFRSYLVETWVFAVLHGLLIGSIVLSIRDIRHEQRALRLFKPAPDADGDGAPRPPADTLAAVLRQFMDEAVRLGRAGFVVPLTDFSDRLDARTEEILGNLRDRVSALLVIGIVGTMFGVYEFAAGAAGRFQGLSPDAAGSTLVINDLAELLSVSMSTAFPVGVVGLLLTVLFQWIAGAFADGLQRDLSRATQDALRSRSAHLASPSDRLADAVAGVRDVVAPLRDLQGTLSASLQPVVDTFGERLDGALGGIAAHLGRLDQTAERLEAAAGGLREGTAALHDQQREFQRLVAEAPRVVEATVALQAEARAELERAAGVVDAVAARARHIAEAVDRAVRNLDGTPDRLASVVDGAARDLTARVDPLLGTIGRTVARLDEVPDRLTSVVDGAARDLASRVEPLAASVDAAAQRLASAPDDLAARVEPAAVEFQRAALAAWGAAADAFVRDVENEHQRFLNDVEQSTSRTETSLTKAADDLGRLASDLRQSILPHLEALIEETLGTRYPEAVEKAGAVGGALAQALAEAAPPVREGAAAVDALAAQVRALQERLRDPDVLFGGPQAHPVAESLQGLRADVRALSGSVSELQARTTRRGPPFLTS